MAKAKILLALICGVLLSLPVQAKLYKWVDDQGVTHYGETVPAEYADKSRSELSKSGRIINAKNILTPEERRAQEAIELQKRIEADALRDQKFHDISLLRTYASLEELELGRQRGLEQIEVRTKAKSRQITDANSYLDDLQKAAFVKTEAGKAVPADLTDDIKTTQELLTKLHRELAQFNIERAALEARFDADRTRYKELTLIKQ